MRSEDDPHHRGNEKGRRRLGIIVGTLLFVVGLPLGLTTYADNAPLCYTGATLVLVGIILVIRGALSGDKNRHANGNSAS